jgi:hypothetical protein
MTTTRRYAGADWVRDTAKFSLSPLGADVADLLGDLACGIYHLSPEILNVAWGNPTYIELRWSGDLATFDSDRLTRLVLLAHDRALRVELLPRSNRYLTMRFHRRQRDGAGWERHPTAEQALETHRRHWPGEEATQL